MISNSGASAQLVSSLGSSFASPASDRLQMTSVWPDRSSVVCGIEILRRALGMSGHLIRPRLSLTSRPLVRGWREHP